MSECAASAVVVQGGRHVRRWCSGPSSHSSCRSRRPRTQRPSSGSTAPMRPILRLPQRLVSACTLHRLPGDCVGCVSQHATCPIDPGPPPPPLNWTCPSMAGCSPDWHPVWHQPPSRYQPLSCSGVRDTCPPYTAGNDAFRSCEESASEDRAVRPLGAHGLLCCCSPPA